MLQIDHVYEFLYQELFKDFEIWYIPNGVPKLDTITFDDICIFTQHLIVDKKIFFYDQEPYISQLVKPYVDIFVKGSAKHMLVTSEQSIDISNCARDNNLYLLYYFFHGFAALDWYRGCYALNYSRSMIKETKYDFVSFNRLITDDRSYRIYFISLLTDYNILDKGLVSFNVADDVDLDWRDEVANTNSKLSDTAKLHIEKHLTNINKLIIDNSHVRGSASAHIPRTIDRIDYRNDTPNYNSMWHIVTETVFYYDKLHLTEKIFKPIVSKQPFMLLAAPGNLAYLKSYGFKTFEGIIDESYDTILDNDQRTEAVVRQLAWYCALSAEEKQTVIEAIAPIVEYNFHHFYGEFKHRITSELLDNTKTLFKEIGYDDTGIDYKSIYHVLTN